MNTLFINRYLIEKTTEFDNWFKTLKDLKAKSKILFRIQKLEYDEHFGDVKFLTNGICKLKINYSSLHKKEI